jgi:hypothetical protein
LIAAGVTSNSILYTNGTETIIGGITNNLPHLTNAANVAGYISWGAHSSLGPAYATNGAIKWTGNSSWWIIQTIESYNGQRSNPSFSSFTQWYSSTAFGGTNYSNTPVGAISNVEEPSLAGNNNARLYFGLWASGKNFGISAWNSIVVVVAYPTPFQAVGDPFVAK